MIESRFVIKDGGMSLASLSLSEGFVFAFDSFLVGYDPNLESNFDEVVNGSAFSGDESSYLSGNVIFNDGTGDSSVVDYNVSGDNYSSYYNVIDPDGNGYIPNYVISEYDDNGTIIPIRDGVSGDQEDRFATANNYFKIHSYTPIKKDETLPNSPYSKIKLRTLINGNVGNFKYNKIGLYLRKSKIGSQSDTNAYTDVNGKTLVGFNNNPNIVLSEQGYANSATSYNSYIQDPKYTSYNNFKNLLTNFNSKNIYSFDSNEVDDELVLFAVLYLDTPIVKKKSSKLEGVYQGYNKTMMDIDIDFELLDEQTRAGLTEIIAYQDIHRDWYTFQQMQTIKDISSLNNHVLDLQRQLSVKSVGSFGNSGNILESIRIVDTRAELLTMVGAEYSGNLAYVTTDKQWYGYKDPAWIIIG